LERAVCKDDPPPVRARNPRVDRRLDRLVLACLAKRHTDRPTAAALADQLAAYRPSRGWRWLSLTGLFG
jgi:hypothetical protein